MSKSVRTTKASFVYENTSKSTVRRGAAPRLGVGSGGLSGTRTGEEAVWGWKGVGVGSGI